MAVANVVAKFEADISDVQAKMAALKASFATAGNSAESMSARMVAVGNGMATVGRKMTLGITLPLAAIGAASVKAAMDFESSLAKIEGLVGIASDEVKAMGEEALAMSANFGKSGNEAADALFFITSAGLRGADAMSVLEASMKASAIGLGDTATIADLATSAVNAYGTEALSASSATDIMVAAVREGKLEASDLAGSMGRVLPIASAMGISFDQVGATFAALSRTGTGAAEAATQLRGIMSSLLKPSKQAEEALAAMGLSSEGLRKQLREEGLLSTLQTLSEAFGENEAAAAMVFGNVRALSGVMDLMGANVATTEAIFQRMTDTAGMTDEAFAITAQTAEFKLNQAMSGLKNTLIEIGATIMPVIARFTEFAKTLLDGFSALPGPMKQVIIAFGGVVAVIGPLLWIGGKVLTMFGVMAAAATKLRTRMATAFAGIKATLVKFQIDVATARMAASTQMGAMAATAKVTALGLKSAFLSMATAVKGFMVSIGPVGWALIAVSVAFEAFSSQSAEAEERTLAYKDALDQVTGAATNASREFTILSLMEKEVGGLFGIGARSFAELADKADLSMTEISKALHGTTEEYDAFIVRLQQAAEQGSITWAEYSLINEALHHQRGSLQDARSELERKNRAEQEAAAATAGLTSATVAAAIAAGEAIGPTQGLTTSIDDLGAAAGEAATEIDIMQAEYNQWLSVTGQISAVDTAAASIDNLGSAAVDLGTDLMGQSPKARDFRGEVVKAFEDSAAAAASLSDDLPTQRAIFTGELIKIVAALRASGVKPADIEEFLGAMDGLPASVSDIMRSAAKAIGDTDFKTEVEKAFDKSVKAGAPMTADAMAQLAEGASKAAKDKLGLTLEPELAGIIKSGTTALRPTAFSNGKATGQSIGSGMANGIQGSSPIVQAAVARVVAQAKAAADAAAEAQSPSRLFAETGDDISAGIGMGIARSAKAATKPIAVVVNKMLKEMNKAFKAAKKLINNAMKGATDAAKENLQKFLDSVTKTFDRFRDRMGVLKDIGREWLSFTRGVRETTPTLESSLARVDALYRRLEKSINAKGKVTDGTVASTQRMAEALRNELATALDLAQANLAEVTGKFDDLRDTVANAIKGILSFSDAKKIGEDIGGGFLEGLRIQAEKAAAFGAIIDQLRRQGLSEEALRLVIAAGAEAGTAIGSELIAGGVDAINEANELVDSVNAIADQIGLDTADQFYGAGVAAAQAQVEGILDQIDKMTPQIMRWMDKLAKKMRRQTVIEVKLSQDRFKVTIDVDKVIREVIAGEGTSVRATAMAAGGVVTGPTLALIGEAGPEAVIPLAQADRYGIGGGTTKTFTIENLTINAAPGERAEDTVPRALRRMAFAMGYDE